MFRLTTELKGLVIDIDSIYSSICAWKWIKSKYQYVFISANYDRIPDYENEFGKDSVLYLESYKKVFLPNPAFHKLVLKRIKLKTTEIIYITGDLEFAKNALSFLSGIILITTEDITYKTAAMLPDLICPSVEDFKRMILGNTKGFLG